MANHKKCCTTKIIQGKLLHQFSLERAICGIIWFRNGNFFYFLWEKWFFFKWKPEFVVQNYPWCFPINTYHCVWFISKFIIKKKKNNYISSTEKESYECFLLQNQDIFTWIIFLNERCQWFKMMKALLSTKIYKIQETIYLILIYVLEKLREKLRIIKKKNTYFPYTCRVRKITLRKIFTDKTGRMWHAGRI